MKRFFTFIGVCIFLTGTLSAQTDFTKDQKQALQKGVMSQVFDQLNQQFGIDFKALANPQLNVEKLLGSSLSQPSALRAANGTLTIRPDSAIIDIDDITIPSFTTITEIKMYFEDYALYKVPDLIGRSIEMELPQKVRIEGGLLSDINLTLYLKQTGPLHSTFGKIDVSTSFTLIGEQNVDLMSLELTSFEGSETVIGGFAFLVNLNGIRDFSNSTLGQLLFSDMEIPAFNSLQTVKPNLILGTVDVRSYAASPTDAAVVIPLDKSLITLDLNSKIFISSIAQTVYASGVETAWVKSLLSVVDDKNLVVDNYAFASAAMEGAGTYIGSTNYTMSNFIANPPLTTTSAIIAAIRAATDPVLYQMVIDDISAAKDTTTRKVIGIKAYEEGTNAIGEVITDDYEKGGLQTIIKATASKISNVIIVEQFEAGIKKATYYFNSNALDYLSTEDIIAKPEIIVSVTDNGLYVNGCEKGTYSIIDMRGRKLAAGVISGNYIQTPSLSKGIYVLIVTDNGVAKAIKFAK